MYYIRTCYNCGNKHKTPNWVASGNRLCKDCYKKKLLEEAQKTVAATFRGYTKCLRCGVKRARIGKESGEGMCEGCKEKSQQFWSSLK